MGMGRGKRGRNHGWALPQSWSHDTPWSWCVGCCSTFPAHPAALEHSGCCGSALPSPAHMGCAVLRISQPGPKIRVFSEPEDGGRNVQEVQGCPCTTCLC